MSDNTRTDNRMVKMAELWERTSNAPTSCATEPGDTTPRRSNVTPSAHEHRRPAGRSRVRAIGRPSRYRQAVIRWISETERRHA
jgi:hypothetical protein